MARPGWPERNRAARSFRQLRRFHHVINSDKVFGTHNTPSVPCVYAEPNFRYTQVWDSTTLTKKMPSESLQSSVGPQRPADQRLSRSTVAAGDATICTSTSDSVTGNEQLCPRQTNAAPSVVA